VNKKYLKITIQCYTNHIPNFQKTPEIGLIPSPYRNSEFGILILKGGRYCYMLFHKVADISVFKASLTPPA
jgi:hypothetical protein